MGISGLLPFLEKASRRCHVAEFRGCTVAIDSYCWLHKGAYGCAEKLVRGEDTNSYVLYCLKYLKMLKSYDIRPILVFDGQHLPAKQQTEDKRREQRNNSRKKASELLRIGKVDEARTHMRLCIDITHKMALELIKECRENGIDCIVAPYEADAQLAYLNIKKFAHFVITEDSDLLLFGCNKIVYKMDIQGFGTLVEADKINHCMKLRPDNYHFNKFRYMCILSGCDYLESLPGVGLKKALKFISMTADPNIYNVLLKLPSYLNLNSVVTNEYRDRFMIADATFQHQLVFDPMKRQLLPLNDPKVYGTKEEYCKNGGDLFNNHLAFQIAIGNLDPLTHEKYDNWCPDAVSLPTTSIWSKQYQKPSVAVKKTFKLAAPNLKNVEVDVQAIEQEKIEYDLKLERELEIYKVVEYMPKKQEVEECETSKLAINKPINVPFLNLKKISKFERTLVDYDQGLTSRFFSSKSDSVSVKPSTSTYDSLLSGISDYTKKCKSLEIEDNIPEKHQCEDLNLTKPERKLIKFVDIPNILKKTMLIRSGAEEEVLPNNTNDIIAESVKFQEIENNLNVTNLQIEEKPEEIANIKTKSDNIAVDDNAETPVKCNKRKSSGVLQDFSKLNKKCLKSHVSNKEDEQKESVIIDVDDIADNQIDQDITDYTKECKASEFADNIPEKDQSEDLNLTKPERHFIRIVGIPNISKKPMLIRSGAEGGIVANNTNDVKSLETESDAIDLSDDTSELSFESRSMSPILSSDRVSNIQLLKQKMMAKNQMNLLTMFGNMKKDN